MKCIVTGLGGRGLHWVKEVRKRDDTEIVGYVEPMEANQQRAVDENDVPRAQIFSSLDDALANTQADYLIDVTPPSVHHIVAEKAFAAGLHVLGEKPLSDDFATARRVADLGTKSGVKHMITQNYRFNGQMRTTQKAVQEGIIGKPGQCDMKFYMPWADFPGSHYVTEPFMFINDMMVHHFDMLRFVLGANPVSVQAITWNQPWGWHKGDAAHAIVFRYADGLVATHTACGCSVGSTTSWNGDWHIEGPNGSLDLDKTGIWYSHLHRAEEKINRRQIEELQLKNSEQEIMDEFYAAIRENREPECSAQDNLGSLAMVFAAIKSSKEHRQVELAELG